MSAAHPGENANLSRTVPDHMEVLASNAQKRWSISGTLCRYVKMWLHGKPFGPLSFLTDPGTYPALIANVAENSVLFCAYGFCQEQLLKLCKPKADPTRSNLMVAHKNTAHSPNQAGSYLLTPLGNATAGFFAAFFSSFSLCPTELIKCKLQAARETGNLRM